MPRWIPDSTGRFELRPYYELDELDRECEEIAEALLLRRHGEVRYPITTDDLHVLIERHGARIDTYADLSEYGADIEGMTEFFADQSPLVSISKKLAADPRRENRTRTTLTHEFGHVHFHEPLYAELFRISGARAASPLPTRGCCMHDATPRASRIDWMEWQAGHVCGAILMPVSALRDRLARLQHEYPLRLGSGPDRAVIRTVRTAFSVSADAARVRLLRLGILRHGECEAWTS